MKLPMVASVLAGIFLFLIPAHGETYLILPLFNLSDSANLEWVGESVSESLRDSLAAEGIIVPDRRDRDEAYHRLGVRRSAVLTRATVIKIGETLDASQIVYGKFQVYEPQVPGGKRSLTISVRILDPKRLRQSAEFSENGALDDLADLTTHLCWQVLRAARPDFSVSEPDYRKEHPGIRVDALEQYIRGLLSNSEEQKHRYFTQAARLDERFSQPCFQLGRLQSAKKNYAVAADWLTRVDPADLHYNEANFLLGLARFNLGDYRQAEVAFGRVAKAVPLNEVLNNWGATLSRLGDPAAVDTLRKALEGDASDPTYHFNVGYALWKQGKFEEAAARFRAVLDRSPDDEQAKAYLERCKQSSGPKPAERKLAGAERLKYEFEETAFRQLKEMVSGKH